MTKRKNKNKTKENKRAKEEKKDTYIYIYKLLFMIRGMLSIYDKRNAFSFHGGNDMNGNI